MLMRQYYCFSHQDRLSVKSYQLDRLQPSKPRFFFAKYIKRLSSNEAETGRFQVQVSLGYTLRLDFKTNQKKNKNKLKRLKKTEHSNNKILIPSIALFKTWIFFCDWRQGFIVCSLAILELRDLPASASWVLGLKTSTTTTWQNILI